METAKKQSRRAIVAACFWVFAHSLAKAAAPMLGLGEYGLSMTEIVESGAFFIVGWVPVYGSIWLDKFFKKDGVIAAVKEGVECADR